MHSPLQTACGSGKPTAVWVLNTEDLTGIQGITCQVFFLRKGPRGLNVDIQPGGVAQRVTIISRRSDHGSVIRTQGKGGDMDFELTLGLERLAQEAVRRDATRNQNLTSVVIPRRLHRFPEQDINDRRLEGGSQILYR